jgi:hypothetical protein
VAEAGRVLAPRLVQPFIEAYECGEPVTVGNARIDRAGIAINPPDGKHIPWTGMGSITIVHVPHNDTLAPVIQIVIRASRKRVSAISVSGAIAAIDLAGIPNGIFLPHLVAYAAAQNGVPVHGLPGDLPDPPAAPRPGSP